MENIQSLLRAIRDVSIQILGSKLTGLYVHGSLAFGCFRWDQSDVDYLAVVSECLSPSEKQAYISALLQLNASAPPKGIEMSVVLEADCHSPRHPIPYDLHFSPAHLHRIQTDLPGFCETMHGYDPDLAAHFAVTRAVGKPLFGPPVARIFAPVSRADYLDSIRYDIENAESDISENPVYVILNLCRALAYGREAKILSKAQGGRWGIGQLPDRFSHIIHLALQHYETGHPFPPDIPGLSDFARYMLSQFHP